MYQYIKTDKGKLKFKQQEIEFNVPDVPMDKVYLRVFIAAVKYMNRRLHITSLFLKKYEPNLEQL